MENISKVTKKDLTIGSVIAVIMAITFSVVGGLPLMITFVPGVVFSWIAFYYIYINKIPLPSLNVFLPVFFIVLAWQFIHLNEEFITGFYEKFPSLYGVMPYSQELFITINMISYFLFTIACIVSFKTKKKFLLIPVLFYIIYGAIGNAIAHTWWSIKLFKYFPGLVTAQAYWFLGPWVLSKLISNRKHLWIFIISFAIILIPLITIFIK